ncbi:MAG: hypothetical protein ACYDCQ_04610 [Dehalococcoidia bacterium]
MTTEQSQTSSGTIIRGADGSLFFLRNEVLEACRITEDDMKSFCSQLLGEHDEVQGFGLTTGPVMRATAFSGPFAPYSPTSSFNARAEGTVMCPGTMHDASFVVLPGSSMMR